MIPMVKVLVTSMFMWVFKRKTIVILGIAGLCMVVAVLAGAWGYRRWTSVSYFSANNTALKMLLPAPTPNVEDRPWWRSEYQNKQIAESLLPAVKWSSKDQPLWKTPIPGRGHATPVTWGNNIFVFTADDSQQTHSLLCLDAENGKVRWTTEVNQGGFMTKHEKNSQASATPICDGQNVYVNFMAHNAIWVVAVDFEGKITWKVEAGPYYAHWGYGSSMAIYQGLLIVSGDNRGSKLGRLRSTSFLAALDRKNGGVIWRVPRPEEFSYGAPIISSVAGKDQLLLASNTAVYSYDPLTGNEFWQCRWNAERTANSVAVGEQAIIATCTQPQRETLCIRADGSGNVTESKVQWRNTRIAADVPSPLIVGNRLILIEDTGIINVMQMEDGKLLWKGRMGSASVSASPVLHGMLVYISDEKGTTYVFDPMKDRLYLEAKNELGEEQYATPVFKSTQVLLRTTTHLWCFSTSNRKSHP